MCKDQKLHYEKVFDEHVDITILVPPTDVERIQKRAPRQVMELLLVPLY